MTELNIYLNGTEGEGGTFMHKHTQYTCTYTDQESTQLLVGCVLTRVHYDDIVCAVFLSCCEQALDGYYDHVIIVVHVRVHISSA